MSDQMDLNQQSGTSLRGRFFTSTINQYLDLFAYFKDSDGNLVDVTTPETKVFRGEGGTIVSQGTPVKVSTGYYKYSFLATDFASGYYPVRFQGVSGAQTLVVEGSLGLEEINLLQSYIHQVRYNVYEVDQTWQGYELDAPDKYWSDEMIYRALSHALQIINEYPPSYTRWTFDSIPCPGLLVSGATAEVLWQRARFEDANTYRYSDAGKSLDISRGNLYRSMAEEWNRQFKGSGGALGGGVLGFKMSFRPRSRGIGSQRLPFKILRPLSFMPNCANIFGV